MSQANLPNLTAGMLPAFAYESITVSSSAIGFTQATLSNSDGHAKRAVVTIENAQLRYRYDGTDPTALEGHLMNPFGIIILNTASSISNFRAIRVGSTNAIIRCSYEH